MLLCPNVLPFSIYVFLHQLSFLLLQLPLLRLLCSVLPIKKTVFHAPVAPAPVIRLTTTISLIINVGFVGKYKAYRALEVLNSTPPAIFS